MAPCGEPQIPARPRLRNARRVRRATQLLQPEQHRQGTLELAVQVDLVPAEPLYLLGVKCRSKGLVANRWTAGEPSLSRRYQPATSVSRK